MTTTENTPLEKITYRKIFGIAFPIILSTLAQNVIALADTIFLGNLGETQLAAAALAAIFYQVLVMVVFGFGVGSQIMIARRLGQGQYKSIGCLFQHSLWFTLFCAILSWILYQLFGHQLLGFLVGSDTILTEVIHYMDARIHGVFFAFSIVAFNAYYVGIARTRNISIATIIMGTANVILDYNLVFGAMGFPALGMQGAAIASVIAEVMGFASYIILSLASPYRKKYLQFGRFDFRLGMIQDLISISYPVMIQYFLSFANYFLFFLFIEALGQRPLAIANITRSMYVLFLMPIWGFASTTASLTSYLYGQGRHTEIKALATKAILLACASITVIVIVFALFDQTILGIFTNDPSLAQESLSPTVVVIVATYIMALAQIVFNTILGKGQTKAGFFIEFADLLIYFLYGWIFIYLQRCSVSMAFGAEIAYTVGLLLISWLYIIYRKKKAINGNR